METFSATRQHVLCALVALVLLCFAVPPVDGQAKKTPAAKSFAREATVVLADGTSLELSEFRFYGDHHGFRGSFYTRSGGLDPRDWTVNEPEDTRFWRTVRPLDAQALSMKRPSPKAEWFDSEFTLVSGEKVSGRLPVALSLGWERGDKYVLLGKVSLLGTQGDFEIDLSAVAQVMPEVGRPGTHTVIDFDGKTNRVTGLHLADRWSAPVSFIIDEYNSDSPIEVGVDRATVSLMLKEVESLVFPGSSDGLIKVKTKKGDEAEGRITSISRVYGKTDSGRIFFLRLLDPASRKYVVRAIRF